MTDYDFDEADITETLGNPAAPRMKKVPAKDCKPQRVRKTIFLQDHYLQKFDRLTLAQKEKKGLSAPELIEKAFELLLEHYKK